MALTPYSSPFILVRSQSLSWDELTGLVEVEVGSEPGCVTQNVFVPLSWGSSAVLPEGPKPGAFGFSS